MKTQQNLFFKKRHNLGGAKLWLAGASLWLARASLWLVIVTSILSISLVSVILASENERPWQKYLSNEQLKITIPKLKSFTLENQVVVYYYRNSLLPKFSLTMYLDGGITQEKLTQTGLTSLYGSTLVYSGGGEKYNRDTLAQEIEFNAASISFGASLERVSFNFSSLTPYRNKGLSVFFEVLAQPNFVEEDFHLKVKQTIQGIVKRKENPSTLAALTATAKLYPNNIRGRISTLKSVKSIQVSNLKKLHQSLWQTKGMSFLAVGDFEVNDLKLYLNKVLVKIKKGEQKTQDEQITNVSKINVNRKKVFFVSKKIPQTTILMKAKGITHNSKEYYAMKLFNLMLGGDSFNSHLMQQIRVKKGWAYSVYSTYSANRYEGEISLFAQTANKNVVDVLKSLRRIMLHPRDFVTTARLAEAKKSISNKFVFLYENPSQLANMQMSMIYDGMPDDYLDTFLDKIIATTIDEVLEVAKKYYNPDLFFTVLVGPKEIREKVAMSKIFSEGTIENYFPLE